MDQSTENLYLVGAQGSHVHIKRGLGQQILTRAEALNLAAYLVALADPTGEDFEQVLEAVRGT